MQCLCVHSSELVYYNLNQLLPKRETARESKREREMSKCFQNWEKVVVDTPDGDEKLTPFLLPTFAVLGRHRMGSLSSRETLTTSSALSKSLRRVY